MALGRQVKMDKIFEIEMSDKLMPSYGAEVTITEVEARQLFPWLLELYEERMNNAMDTTSAITITVCWSGRDAQQINIAYENPSLDVTMGQYGPKVEVSCAA